MNSQSLHPFDLSRPLQFVASFDQWCGTQESGMRACFQNLLDMGVSGLVTTVSLDKYLSDDNAWDVLRRGVQIAHEMGLRIWIHDEKGYPSGAAGGLVLEQNPDVEARGLNRVVDLSAGKIRYEVVRLYQDTHATANTYEKRHYINILDPAAVATFIAFTHDRYARTLQPIGDFIEAFITDEPSLISTYVPQGKDYPQTLPWDRRLPEIFRSRKGYALSQYLESLFSDTGTIDKEVRCDFYEVVADLCAETFFAQIQNWCQSHQVSSSGHLLGEETLVWQTLFDGDPFSCYRRFDIQGIDMILSDPMRIMREKFFLVPKVASSAARSQDKRRVMCEISDFLGAMDGHHATLAEMKSTAGILMSLGITDLVSMYTVSLQPKQAANPDPKNRRFSADEFQEYTDYVGRVNAILAEGKISPRTAVLHPIVSLWANFTPSTRSMYEPHPNPLVRFIDDSFTNLCRDFLQHQIEFDIVDEKIVADARVEGRTLIIGKQEYDVLVLPPMDTIRLRTLEIVHRFVEQGGSVFAHPLIPKYAAEGPERDGDIKVMVGEIIAKGGFGGTTQGTSPLDYLVNSRVPPPCHLNPSSPNILCTTVSKEGGQTYFLVNTSSDEYTGTCTFRSTGEPTIIDPATGEEHGVEFKKVGGASSQIELTLPPFVSLFVKFG